MYLFSFRRLTYCSPICKRNPERSCTLALGYGLPLIVTQKVKPGLSEANENKVQVVPEGYTQALSKALKIFYNTPPGLRKVDIHSKRLVALDQGL